jgi:hypothetical protein
LTVKLNHAAHEEVLTQSPICVLFASFHNFSL